VANPADPAAKPPQSKGHEAEHLPNALLARVQALHGVLDGLQRVFEDVNQEEREHADREHGEGNAQAVTHELESTQGQAKVDRESGKRA